MSILNKLSKLGAAALLAASVMAMPAVAQHNSNHGQSSVNVGLQKVKFQGQRRGNSRGHNRGNFRGNNRGNFRGHNRGNFRGNNRGNFRGHNRGNFRGNNRGNFRGHNRGNFRGNNRGNFRGHNRGNFRGNNRGNFRGHNRGNFRGNQFHNNGFRGNRSNHNRGNFRGNGFNRGSGVVVVSPVYAVGGLYGVTNNTVFISDFGGHGLYSPPRGHHWVCDKGSKDAVLVAIATGAIIAIAADSLLNPY